MTDKILWTFIISDFLFLVTGGLLIGFALVTQSQISLTPNVTNVATNLLLAQCPLTGTSEGYNVNVDRTETD
jgi:hypothetical protein